MQSPQQPALYDVIFIVDSIASATQTESSDLENKGPIVNGEASSLGVFVEYCWCTTTANNGSGSSAADASEQECRRVVAGCCKRTAVGAPTTAVGALTTTVVGELTTAVDELTTAAACAPTTAVGVLLC